MNGPERLYPPAAKNLVGIKRRERHRLARFACAVDRLLTAVRRAWHFGHRSLGRRNEREESDLAVPVMEASDTLVPVG